MEDNSLPPSRLVQPSGGSSNSDVTDLNAPVSQYSIVQKNYPLESLEVRTEGDATKGAPISSLRSVPFSRRKATVVSLFITVLVIFLTGITATLFVRKNEPEEAARKQNIPTQDVSLENAAEVSTPPGLVGAEESLLVNGDIIARGDLKVISGGFVSLLRSQTLTSNQTITLPNASGAVCLDSNNCNFALQSQLADQTNINTQQTGQIAQMQTQLGQIVTPPAGVTSLNNQSGDVSIQGSLNQVSVSTANGTITLSTPQDLDANANVQFGNLTLGASGQIRANSLLQTNAGNDVGIDAGNDSVVFTSGGRIFQFPNSGAGTQTICTTTVGCGGGGGGGVDDVNGLTGSVTLQGTSNQVSVATGAGTITFSTPQNINTTSSPTFAALTLTGLGSGNVRVSGGVLTTGSINLATETTGTLGTGNGGTGITGTPTNGQLLIGNGTNYTLGTLGNNGGLTITNGAGSIGLAVNYGASANTAVQGNTSLTCPSGSGNLTGGGNSITLGTGGSCTAISIVNNPTFSTSVTTPSLILTGAGNNGTLQVANLGQATTYTLPDPGGASATICLTTGNCAGTGGGVTGSGTNNRVAKFTSTGSTVGDSTITDDGTNVSLTGDVTIQGGDATLGTTLQSGTLLISDGSSNTGSIVTASLTANQTYTLPNASGDFCLSSGNCIGGGGGGAPNGAQYLLVSLDGTLTNDRAITAGSNISFTDGGANGNFTVATVQNPTFTTSVTTPLLQSTGALNITPGGTLTVGATSQQTIVQGTTLNITSNGATNDITLTSADQIILNATGTIELQDNTNVTGTLAVTGSVTGGTYNGQTISSSASLTGTLSVASTVAVQGASLTVGTAAQQGSLILNDGSSNTGTVQTAALGQNTVYTLPDPGGASATICLTTGNCAGVGGGITGSGTNGTIPRFTGAQTIGDSIITQSGTTINIAGDLTLSTDLAVAQGGTGAGTFTSNGVLYGNGTGALQVTSAPSAGQVLIGNGSGVPTFTTFTGDITVSGTGLTTIQPDSVALGTDTTGNYIATISAGSGIDVTGSGSESATPTIALGPLTANWSQTGAFDVILNNASSELRILESAGATFYGTLDVGDLSADRTYTLPNAGGTICLDTGNCAGTGTGVTAVTPGTTGRLAVFTAGQDITSSWLLQNSSTLELDNTRNLSLLGGNLSVTGTGTFTSTLAVQGASATIGAAALQGSLILNDGDGETVSITIDDVAANSTIKIPDTVGASDTFCLLTLANCSGGGTTLQTAYDAGNTITTTNNRNITFNLADTTTDSSFIVNLQGTGNLFDVQDGGTSALTVEDGGNVGIGINNPTARLHLAAGGYVQNGTITSNTAAMLINPTITTNSATLYGIQNNPFFEPGASVTEIRATGSEVKLQNSANGVTNLYGVYSRLQTDATYTGTITNGNGFVVDNPTLSGSKISNYTGLRVINPTANSGNTSGTTRNIGIDVQGFTTAAGAGGTMRNFGLRVSEPTGTGGGTNHNTGILIATSGTTQVDGNWAFYSASTYNSNFAGNLTIGDTTVSGTTPDIRLQGDGSAVFNEQGAAVDFRIESDTNANMFNVSGTNDSIGIGTAAGSDGVVKVLNNTSVGKPEIYGIGTGDTNTLDIASQSGIELRINETGATGGATLSIYSDQGLAFSMARDGDFQTKASSESFLQGYLRLGVTTASIGDNGGGTPASGTVSPNSTYVEFTCNDANGCNVTLDESGTTQGQTLVIVNVGANQMNIADITNVQQVAGAVAFAGTQYSGITFIKVIGAGTTGLWVETGGSAN